MAKFMRWVTLKGRCHLPRVKAQQHIGLVGAGNVPLIHRNEHHAVAVHGLRTQIGFIELPKTRLDILPTSPLGMDEGLPPRIPFLPDKVLHHPAGCVVTGMEGELLWLDLSLHPVGDVSVPIPMRVHQATVNDQAFQGMWLDRELLLAFMASLPLDSQTNGVRRADLRTSINTTTSHHPAGNLWSHSLDAEPMALAGQGQILVFELYRRGLYSISTNAEERWRMASPTWQYSKRRPRNEETVALHIVNDEIFMTSKGGHVQRRSLETGQLLEEFVLSGVEGPVEHHYRNGVNELVATARGDVFWLKSGEIMHHVRLSGPVQFAVWDERFRGWRIAGWREEAWLGPHLCDRRETREIPIHIHPIGNGALLLFNDGSWENSAFESLPLRGAEEE